MMTVDHRSMEPSRQVMSLLPDCQRRSLYLGQNVVLYIVH